ncbi:aminotransferase class I/II-fold pyridoxal phosphate-dependent enzyme [Nocardia stercoris]|uniref:Aminotransferase class I/II-fold pyridoxal phosphate-dependent enzyme n=1 Tax=Nocardia stercoris TaxID=2483361 RepID=A0A3M2LDD1_9NOCA|nr:aminotransferase class I/II-fold pyridoxal phosphate-dependent enzyme [Nocardia stercoris]RMI33975.1 aminotransferase class I/II-fold pyridoxal phosphate-dependent enzyme [Nocardia stercoris]
MSHSITGDEAPTRTARLRPVFTTPEPAHGPTLLSGKRSAERSPLPRKRFDLALSEHPLPPLPSVQRALHATIAGANRYPEFLPHRLPTLIADHLGLAPDQIVVGAGATGVALQVMQALTRAGQTIVYAEPTFDGYPILAAMCGLEGVGVPLDVAGRQDLWAMLRAVGERTGLVAVCRPHNPTGTLIPGSELKAFLFALPRRVPVLLDEAYVEFLGAAERIDPGTLLQRYPNLLILRTFSKAYGLAGLRIGYAIGRPELIARVRRLQLPFGVPESAAVAVAASYAAAHELADRVLHITVERDHLRAALRRNGIPVPRSSGNFLYLPGRTVTARLTAAGIAVKGYPDGSARIAVGDPDAGTAVITALEPPVQMAALPSESDDTDSYSTSWFRSR